jgi:hypothetical protein
LPKVPNRPEAELLAFHEEHDGRGGVVLMKRKRADAVPLLRVAENFPVALFIIIIS